MHEILNLILTHCDEWQIRRNHRCPWQLVESEVVMLTVSAVPSIILAFLFGKWQSSRHVVSVLAEEVRVKGCEFGVSSMNILFELFLPVQYDSSWIFASGGEGHGQEEKRPPRLGCSHVFGCARLPLISNSPALLAYGHRMNQLEAVSPVDIVFEWDMIVVQCIYYIYIIINLYRNNIYIYISTYIYIYLTDFY